MTRAITPNLQLQPYAAYRDSGVPWLGPAPAHWEVRRLKRFAQLNPGKSEAAITADDLVTFLPMEKVGSEGSITASDQRPAAAVRSGFTYFRRSDVIVAKITPCFENGKGACLDSLPTPVGFGSTEFHVLRPTRLVLPRYLHRITTLPEFRRRGADAMTGAAGQRRVPESFVGNFPAPLPPIEEQQAIVAFLDNFDRRINRLIRAKRRLIALLNEQKQAITHQAVTRGLDPNVRLKPSGIEWLGDIPEHWEVRRLKYCATVQIGITLGKRYENQELVERPYLRVANVQNGFLDLETITHIQVPLSEAAATELRAGDVLMTEGGDIDKLGRGALWTGEIPHCLHQNHVFAVRPDRRLVLPEFLSVLMGSPHGRSYFQLTAKQTTNLASTNRTALMAFPLPLPCVEEQRQILDRADVDTREQAKAISRATREIDLFREYRTRLIADVVTGKLDVRGVDLPPLADYAPAEDVEPNEVGIELQDENESD